MRLHYQEKEKTVEPHDYGIQKGVVRLLAFSNCWFQSRPTSELAVVGQRQNFDVQLFDQTFPGGRPSRKHHTWDELS